MCVVLRMPTTLDKLITTVAPCVFAYGVGRKVFLLKDATVDERQENTKTGYIEYNKVPLLHTQKAVIVALGGLTTMALFPFYIYEDVKRCERYIRGIPNKRASNSYVGMIDHIVS